MKKFLFPILALAAVLVGCNKEQDYLHPITLDFTLSTPTIVKDEPFTVTVDIKGGRFPYVYAWDFGDGITGSKYTETVTYTTGGQKTITLTVTDANGDQATATRSVEVAEEPPLPQVDAPSGLEIVNISNVHITVGWDEIASSQYFNQTYDFELTDPAGTVMNYVTTATLTGASQIDKFDNVIAFGGLDPNTEYKFRIRAKSTDESVMLPSDWVEITATTSPERTPDPDAILEEHFDGFIWAADYFYGGYGFRPNDDASKAAESIDIPADEFKGVNTTTGSYFATFTAAFRKNSNILDGWAGNAVYGSVGVPKFGTASGAGWLETPELSKISGTKDITVTFKAAPFYEWNKKPGTAPEDYVDKNVTLDITVSGGGTVTEGAVADLRTLDPLTWGTYTVKISGATASTKVRISADHGSPSCRFFLDDIVIK